MATSKSSSRQTGKKGRSGSTNGAGPKRTQSRATSSGGSAKRGATKSRSRSSSAKSSSKTRSKSNAGGSKQSTSPNGTSRVGQAVGTVKDAATKAKGPMVAVSAAAAGVAGGLALRGRTRRGTVLGVPTPRSLNGRSLGKLDAKSITKAVGEASKSFAKTSKSVSRDLERAGDRAEQIGRILS